MDKPMMLAVGANPAWQKALHFAGFQADRINRADSMLTFASGKGVNFCRAAHRYGAAEAKLLQFTGGDNGRLVEQDLVREGLMHVSVHSVAPTRCCTTCLGEAEGSMTEIIEPSGAPGPDAEAELLAELEKAMPGAALLALCGQLPQGMNVDFYVRCVQLAAAHHVPVLVDSYRNIAPVLAAGVQLTLKINRDELAALTGIAEVHPAMQSLLDAYRLDLVAVTAGAGNAYLATPTAFFAFRTPKLAHVVNPVGSGDTASAVLASELVGGTAPEEAFARAIAAASANCLSMKCAEFELETARALRREVVIETISQKINRKSKERV